MIPIGGDVAERNGFIMIEKPKREVLKASHNGSKQPIEITRRDHSRRHH